MSYQSMNVQILANYLCVFQIIIYSIYLVTGNPIILYLMVSFLSVNIILILYIHKLKLSILNVVIFLINILLFIIFAFLSPNEYIQKYSIILVGVHAFSLGLLFRGISAVKLLLYLNFIFNFLVIFTAIRNNFNPDYGNHIFSSSSRNIVSGYLISLIIYYLYFCYIYEKKINLVLIVLFFINCISLYGRTGVALSTLVVLYSLYKKLNYWMFFVLMIAVLSSLGSMYVLLSETTNFSSGLDTPRLAFVYEYLSFMRSDEILFGRSINQCCSLIASFAGNPHNSFIKGHMYFGIYHTIFSFIIMFIIILSRKVELIFLSALLIIRYNLDSIGLFSTFDIVIFAIFSYSYSINFNSK